MELKTRNIGMIAELVINESIKEVSYVGYIMDLRKVVGHRPLEMVGAGAVILNEARQILLQQRTDNDCWGIPGGSIELGERLEDAARREVFEETGLTLGEMTLFDVFSGEELHYIYPNGDEVYVVAIIYLTEVFTGTPFADGVETKDIRFFDLDKLPENLNPADRPVLRECVLRLSR